LNNWCGEINDGRVEEEVALKADEIEARVDVRRGHRRNNHGPDWN
jgi:hypothetical protein